MRDWIELSRTGAQWGRREQGPSAEPFQGHRALAWQLIPWVMECRPAFFSIFSSFQAHPAATATAGAHAGPAYHSQYQFVCACMDRVSCSPGWSQAH